MARLWMLFSVCAAALGLAAPAMAQSASCKVVNDAMLKSMTTPHHMTTSLGGKPSSETIVVDDAIYTKRGTAAWRKSPMTSSAMLKQETENIKNAKEQTCQVLKTDTIDGQKVTVYKTHVVNAASTEDATIAVSTSLGLPIRSEIGEEVGPGGAGGKMVLTWDYANIKAPVVK